MTKYDIPYGVSSNIDQPMPRRAHATVSEAIDAMKP